jgi:hypothetical protein
MNPAMIERARNARFQHNNTFTPRLYNNNSVTTKEYIFDGARENYFRFETQLIYKLEQQTCNYLLDETEVHKRMTPPELPPYIQPVPNETPLQAEERKYIMQYNMQQHYENLKKYNRHKEDMYKDFNKAIATVKTIVMPQISTEIDIVKQDPVYLASNPMVRFSLIMDMIRTEHGPNGEDTARILKDKLSKLSGEGKNGFRDLILEYKTTVSHLERNIRLDANKQPIAAGTVHERTYRPYDEELRGYLKEALRKTTKLPFHQIYLDIINNINISPDDIIEKIQTLVTNKVEENPIMINNNNIRNNSNNYNPYGNKRYNNDYNRQSRSSLTDYQDEDHTDNINIQQDQDTTSYSNSSSYQHIPLNNNINNNDIITNTSIVCHNCQAQDHYVKDCKARICGHCGQFFDTVALRKTHYLEKHNNKRKERPSSPANSSQRQNNKRPYNINNNRNNNTKNNNNNKNMQRNRSGVITRSMSSSQQDDDNNSNHEDINDDINNDYNYEYDNDNDYDINDI